LLTNLLVGYHNNRI